MDKSLYVNIWSAAWFRPELVLTVINPALTQLISGFRPPM